MDQNFEFEDINDKLGDIAFKSDKKYEEALNYFLKSVKDTPDEET